MYSDVVVVQDLYLSDLSCGCEEVMCGCKGCFEGFCLFSFVVLLRWWPVGLGRWVYRVFVGGYCGWGRV